MMPTRRGFLFMAGAAFARNGMRVVEVKGEKVVIAQGSTTLLEYRCTNERPKSYVHPLCLPDGKSLTLDGPRDHIHHRGLMVAWSEVNGIDFWGEDNPARHGQIVHQKFLRLRDSPVAEIVAVNHWTSEGKLLLVERRTVRVPPPSADAVWLDWTTELSPPHEAVKLAAGNHVYNGLGIRVVPSMDGGSVLNSNGASSIEKANGDRATWCAYHAAGAAVAFFDHPTNRRHPNPFFVMNKPFGYMSAAPTFREPFDLAVKETIRFRWGVLTFNGAPDADLLNRRFESWSKTR
jgi:hypothetical protein